MNKQERLIAAVTGLILILGFIFVLKAVNAPEPGEKIEPIAAPTEGEAPDPLIPPPPPETGEGIDVQTYKGRRLPFCGLHADVRIYAKANDRTDTGETITACSRMKGNLVQFGWAHFKVNEGGPEDEWLAVEQLTDAGGIDLPQVEVRYVRREEVGTPSMIVAGDKRWPLELGWAQVTEAGGPSVGFVGGWDGWCEHRDQPMKIRNLPPKYRVETLVSQRGEDDCST